MQAFSKFATMVNATATTTTGTFSTASALMMSAIRIARHGVTHPFGDERSVHQAFPAAVNVEEADPFLMCDYFDMVERNGPAKHADEFPVNWHPHRGFDICTYIRSPGRGRHGDSLGNRETYGTPGMQWVRTGSGVEHAEGGATIEGDRVQGFQIWVNVPATEKMQSPRYGTVPTEDLPSHVIQDGAAAVRVLAGSLGDWTGPFATTQPVQMLDFELSDDGTFSFDIAENLNTAMVYVYEGSLYVNGERATQGSVVLLNATDTSHDGARGITLRGASGGKAVLFAGQKLDEPIAWHGPIVMNTQAQIASTLQEIRSGQFPPERVAWDYKRIASKPAQTNQDEL